MVGHCRTTRTHCPIASEGVVVDKTPLFQVHMPKECLEVLPSVLTSGKLMDGPYVESFEKGIAEIIGNPNIAAISDASGALTIALSLAGVRPGSEVIVSPVACGSTIMPIANLFATPVWCDINPKTGMFDAEQVKKLINDKTRAILVYHYGGDVADLEPLIALAKERNLTLIDDASNAIGATLNGTFLGNTGTDFTVFSFRPTKHITTVEGGALVCKTSDPIRLARRMRRLGIDPSAFRNPITGELSKGHTVDMPGYNFTFSNVAGAMGVKQLPHVKGILEKNRANGKKLTAALAKIQGIRLLSRPETHHSAFWVYTLIAEKQESLQKKLSKAGIQSQKLHPRHDEYPCFKGLEKNLPGVDEFYRGTLSIPCGWWVSDEQVDHIIQVISSGW